MSSSFLRLISTDPLFIPTEVAQKNAKVFLSRRYNDNQIEIISNENVELIDQGSNFESVSCNLCGKVLDIEDWQNAIDVAYQTQFANLIFTTSCCKKDTSLNDLTYEQPAGFAKHVTSIAHPQQELTKDELEALQSILGTQLRIIWAHY
ncbi:MAG TPA: hypothetical protein VIZ28_11685 [Chitinophagaceae bacterium]